jgi:hypothetical protein
VARKVEIQIDESQIGCDVLAGNALHSIALFRHVSGRLLMPFSGPGFVVYDETGKPCLTLGYLYESEAETGRAHIAAALANG